MKEEIVKNGNEYIVKQEIPATKEQLVNEITMLTDRARDLKNQLEQIRNPTELDKEELSLRDIMKNIEKYEQEQKWLKQMHIIKNGEVDLKELKKYETNLVEAIELIELKLKNRESLSELDTKGVLFG